MVFPINVERPFGKQKHCSGLAIPSAICMRKNSLMMNKMQGRRGLIYSDGFLPEVMQNLFLLHCVNPKSLLELWNSH